MSSRYLLLGLGLLGSVLGAAADMALAQPRTVVVTEADCARLVKHMPAPDVSYQGNTDVYGRPVASADLNGGAQIVLPETYAFEVEIQPVEFARRRQLANQRAALAEQITAQRNAQAGQVAANAATASQLAGEAATLASREATFQRDFETAAQTIINNTGGANPTAAQLAARTTQLATLETNTVNSPTFLRLQQDLANNQQDLALNAQEASQLQAQGAALDAEQVQNEQALIRDQALISSRGLDQTKMSVGTVTLDLEGRVYFNGQPLTNAEQAELAAACQRVVRPR